MAVTKRTRFEVLRRDNFTCRYCRSTEGVLTIDHVTPVALGGTDDPENLVAACRDCNAGKASSSPDGQTVDDVAADAARWAAAIKQAAAEAAEARAAREQRLAGIKEEYGRFLPPDWAAAVDGWLDAGLDIDEARECIRIALRKPYLEYPDTFAYACGVAKNKIAALHERAKQLLKEG